jgi:hypothetical protein
MLVRGLNESEIMQRAVQGAVEAESESVKIWKKL